MPVYRRDITTEEKEWWTTQLVDVLKQHARQRGISQQDFAKMLDMSNSGLCHFERGRGSFNLYLFYRACTLLGKCANSMMGRRIKS